MQRISIEQGYQWMQRFLQREWRLVLPVALAFMALPNLAVELLVPAERRRMPTPPVDMAQLSQTVAVMLPALALVAVASLIGSLAVTALALVPGISVREAIVTAFRRFPVQLGASLLIGAALGLAVTAVSVAAGMAGLSMRGMQALVIVLVFGGAVFLSIRLLLLSALIVDRPIGVVAAIRQAWAASAQLFWRLLGAAAIFGVGALVLLLAVQWVLGGLVLALGAATDQAELARALVGIVSAVCSALVSAAFAVLLAGLYRQTLPGRD